MKELLTVVIPTYNRQKELLKTLEGLGNQTDQDFKIVILDNNSNYEIVLNKNIKDKTKIIKRNFNIGMLGNMSNAMLIENTEWIWLLSDDDKIDEDAIENIKLELKNSSDIGMIKFSTGNIGKAGEEKAKTVNSLEELFDYYDKRGWSGNGNFVFISNVVFNTEELKDYICKAFDYSCTQVPFMMPILFYLNDKKGGLKFSSKKIVDFNFPEDNKIHRAKVIFGFTNIWTLNLELKLDKNNFKRLLKLFNTSGYKYTFKVMDKEKDSTSYFFYKAMYNNFFKYLLSFSKKIKYKKLLLKLK